MSTATTLKVLVPGWIGMDTLQVVTLLQVTGHSTPLMRMVLIPTGAEPLRLARLSLTRTEELMRNGARVCEPICTEMLDRAELNQLLIADGFSTLRPLATKVLYLASIKGALLAGFKGPL